MTYRACLSVTACLTLQGVGLQGMVLEPTAMERLAVWEWRGVERVVAVGDLHGSNQEMIRLLKGAALVDESLHWIGGEDHLVVAGDFLDRGSDDRRLMDLLRRLQHESGAAGGRVHVLLGNHEVMNLLRDTRYVSAKSYREFAAEEKEWSREAAWRSFAAVRNGSRKSTARLAEFRRRFPSGYFARQESFNARGEYGSWLLRLPVIVKINGVVYLHGGVTEEFATLGIDEINRRAEDVLRRHLDSRAILEAEGIVTPLMGLKEVREAARNVLVGRRQEPRAQVREAAQGLLDTAGNPILGPLGPLWYRGNSLEDERIEREMIERSLELIGAKSMVVAHSPTDGNHITSRFHGQLFRVDHGLVQSKRPLALVVEQGEALVLDASTRQLTKPVRELPTRRSRSVELTEISDRKLEEFLSKGEVIDSRDLGRGRTRPRLVLLERSGLRRRGIFKAVDEGGGPIAGGATDRYQHEVAAYRLDRVIGLNMVPVTVIREIESRRGSLQSWVDGAVDQEAAEAYKLDLYETETTGRQLAVGRVFDALIGNHDRKPADILRLVSEERVFLIDHSRAFSTSAELAWAEEKVVPISPQLSLALRSLNRKGLEKKLGSLISNRQIDALLERRDKILGMGKATVSDGEDP